MNKEIKKIKAVLRNKSVRVAVFDSNNYSKDIPLNEYVLLEDALKAVEDALNIQHDTIKVLDLQTNSLHDLVSVDFDEGHVVMESKQYGRTSNKITAVKFIH